MAIDHDFADALESELRCWTAHLRTAITKARTLPPMKKRPGIVDVPDLPPDIVERLKALILKSGLPVEGQAELANLIITMVKSAIAIPLEWDFREREREDNKRAKNARERRALRYEPLQRAIEKFAKDEIAKHPNWSANAIADGIYELVRVDVEAQNGAMLAPDAVRKRVAKLLRDWTAS